MMLYKHAILLHKLYNGNPPKADWLDLNFQQNLTSRQTKFIITNTNNYMVGNNILTSRLSVLNNYIELKDLNLSLDSFKVKYEKVFLPWKISSKHERITKQINDMWLLTIFINQTFIILLCFCNLNNVLATYKLP